MKHLKNIFVILLETIVLTLPGILFLWWSWDKVSAIFSILSTIGLEIMYVTLFSLIVLIIKTPKVEDKESDTETLLD